MAQQESSKLWYPQHWPAWLGMGLGWALAQMPLPAQMWLGRRLGELAYALLWSRRRVVATNLALCFPRMNAAERQALVLANFRSVGMGAMETLLCWWAPDARIERLTDSAGIQHLLTAARPGHGLLLYSGHFTSLELGVRMAQIHLRRQGIVTTAMYKAPHNPVVNRVMRNRRETHIGERSIPKDDVRGMIKALRRGRAVWYAADQKAINKFSGPVPFFGTPAATNLATGRLASMGNASVLPFFTLRRRDFRGYRLVVSPPLTDFPGDDEYADALRLNRILEEVVRKAPEQYFWLHKRFKDGPSGNPYRRPKAAS